MSRYFIALISVVFLLGLPGGALAIDFDISKPLDNLPTDPEKRMEVIDQRLDQLEAKEIEAGKAGLKLPREFTRADDRLQAEFDKISKQGGAKNALKLFEQLERMPTSAELDQRIRDLAAKIDEQQRKFSGEGKSGSNSPEQRFKQGLTLTEDEVRYLKDKAEHQKLLGEQYRREQMEMSSKARAEAEAAKKKRMVKQQQKPKVGRASPRARLGGSGIKGGGKGGSNAFSACIAVATPAVENEARRRIKIQEENLERLRQQLAGESDQSKRRAILNQMSRIQTDIENRENRLELFESGAYLNTIVYWCAQ